MVAVPQHSFGLAVYDEHLFWTDWVLRAVVRVNKYTGGDVIYLQKNIERQPMSIVVVAPDVNDCKHIVAPDIIDCLHLGHQGFIVLLVVSEISDCKLIPEQYIVV